MCHLLSTLIETMQQFKRHPKPVPLPVPTHSNDDSLNRKQHIANLTTQIFCSLMTTYTAPFSLREEQIDRLIKTSYKLACHINEMTDKKTI